MFLGLFFFTSLHIFSIYPACFFSSSGYHSISQTDALCREQEGNGGLDHRTQIGPEVGNLWGEPDTPLKYSLYCIVYSASDDAFRDIVRVV